MLRDEPHLQLDEFRFWTDSQIVLQYYIANESQCFHVFFVGNRVGVIRRQTRPSQW